MEPTALPFLSLTPLSGATTVSLNSLRITAETAEIPPGEPSVLFAQLMSQLSAKAPAVDPVVPEPTTVFPPVAQGIAVQALPLSGNVLPLSAALVEAETSAPVEHILPEVIDVEQATELAEVSQAITDTTEQAEVLPLPGLPQPVQIKPVIQADPDKPLGRASRPVATAAQAKPQVQAAPFIATRLVNEPVAPVVQKPPVEITQLAGHPQQQPVASIAPDIAGLVTTAAPAISQPLTVTTEHALTIHHPVADSRWGESLGQRVMWMTENGIGRAQIRLNPPELGPIDIRISVANDEAKVAFTVQHGTTREAVEFAMPRLREMFAQQGIELSDSSVSQHSPGDRHQAGDTGDSMHGAKQSETTTAAIEDTDIIAGGHAQIREGLIDTYV
ncbi:MAG: flagellar hook-length control protein FliK [Gammaproteobacteria bacterium]|nr:flagellar hook-length control protein FliK [Gammaproteobacteria bacterium]